VKRLVHCVDASHAGSGGFVADRPRSATRRELADPVGPLEVREAEDVDQLGASRRRKGLQALAEGLLHLLDGHGAAATALTTALSPFGPG
jgi:hypothetical protein